MSSKKNNYRQQQGISNKQKKVETQNNASLFLLTKYRKHLYTLKQQKHIPYNKKDGI